MTFMRTLKEVKSVTLDCGKLTGGTLEDVVSSPKLTSFHLYLFAENIDFLSTAANIEHLTLLDISSDTNLSVLTTLSKLKKVCITRSLTEKQYLITDQLIISGVVVELK